jgi:flagellar motor switch protein FliN/FliY
MLGIDQISAFAEISLDVSVELDRRVMSLGEVLDLQPGSVIRMTRSAGENIDLLIGDSLVGFGEMVIIEDTMGIRITDFNVED